MYFLKNFNRSQIHEWKGGVSRIETSIDGVQGYYQIYEAR